MLGDKVISAYERMPLAVVGNNRNCINELLQIARDDLEGHGRPNSEIDPSDPRIDIRLRHLGKTRHAIPADGERVVLLDNANLSTGGTSVDVTDAIDASFSDISIKATKALGLQLCGVDILCEDLTRDAASQIWNIIELNAAPGLDNYSSLGPEQANRVTGIYRQILEYLSHA